MDGCSGEFLVSQAPSVGPVPGTPVAVAGEKENMGTENSIASTIDPGLSPEKYIQVPADQISVSRYKGGSLFGVI